MLRSLLSLPCEQEWTAAYVVRRLEVHRRMRLGLPV